MSLKLYDPKLKADIIAAATEARSAGKPWAVAFSAAREAGYKGSLQGIMKLLRDAGKLPTGKRRGRKPGRKTIVKVAPIAAKRGPGRPQKVTAETGSLEALVAKVVCERVKGVLERAIAVLQQAKGE